MKTEKDEEGKFKIGYDPKLGALGAIGGFALSKKSSGKTYKDMYHTTARLGETARSKGDMWFDFGRGGFSEEILSQGDIGTKMSRYSVNPKNPVSGTTTKNIINKLWKGSVNIPKTIKTYLEDKGSSVEGNLFDDNFMSAVDNEISKRAKSLGYDAVIYNNRGHGGREMQVLDRKIVKHEKVVEENTPVVDEYNILDDRKKLIELAPELKDARLSVSNGYLRIYKKKNSDITYHIEPILRNLIPTNKMKFSVERWIDDEGYYKRISSRIINAE